MAEVEIGLGKAGRRAYALREVAIVPSRRTRDPSDVDISWELDAFRFDLPFMVAPSDAVVSPATAAAIGRVGGLGVLDAEGLWARYDDPVACVADLAGLPEEKAAARHAELLAEPVRPELLEARVREIRDAGVVAAVAVSPPRTAELAPVLVAAEIDLLVIRGPVVSAEHVSRNREPLDLKRFVREIDVPVVVGGCASYQAALHLMRTGAAGVLVGAGGAAAAAAGIGVAQATAVADVRAARMRHLDETGVYCQVIADGRMVTAGDIARAVVCGADAVMLHEPLLAAVDVPAHDGPWGPADGDGAARSGAGATLAEILVGPTSRADGTRDLAGGLRTAMATCGYETLKEFQKAELVVTPVDPEQR